MPRRAVNANRRLLRTREGNPLLDTPLVVMGANCLQCCFSDSGITDDGGGFAQQMDDITANALHYTTPGGAGTRPQINANSLNGVQGLIFDGSDDFMESSLVLPAPGTTPTFMWGVIRQLSWTPNERILADASATNCMVLYQNANAPEVRMFNGLNGNVNGGLPINTAGRFEAYFNNGAAGYLKCRAVNVTAPNTGNTAGGTGRRIARGEGSSTLYGHLELFCLAHFNVLPNGSQLSRLDAFASAKYGAGVLS